MASRLDPTAFQAEDANGDAVASGVVYFYLSRTTTLATVYSDAAATTPISQPITLTAAGKFPVDVYLKYQAHTVKVTDANGADLPGYPVNDVWPIPDGTQIGLEFGTFVEATAAVARGEVAIGAGAKTRGYSTVGDGGNCSLVRENSTQTYYPGGSDLRPVDRESPIEAWGTAGDGATDDAAKFQQAAAFCSASTSELHMRRRSYRIGSGTEEEPTIGTTINPTSGFRLFGNGGTLIHDAAIAVDENEERDPEDGINRRLFDITGDDVRLQGFVIDGQDNIRQGINLNGVVRRLRMIDVDVIDSAAVGMSISPGQLDDEGGYFNDVRIEGGRSIVSVLPNGGGPGSGSAINSFGRHFDTTNLVPLNQNLFIRNRFFDVTAGSLVAADQQAQCVKLNNVQYGEISNCTMFGGGVAIMTISNGTRDFSISTSMRVAAMLAFRSRRAGRSRSAAPATLPCRIAPFSPTE